jgi:Ca2+-binding EF-hand superfamily protein
MHVDALSLTAGGRPQMPRILQVMDTDGDGRLTLEEFMEALQWIGENSSSAEGR